MEIYPRSFCILWGRMGERSPNFVVNLKSRPDPPPRDRMPIYICKWLCPFCLFDELDVSSCRLPPASDAPVTAPVRRCMMHQAFPGKDKY